MFCHVMSIHMYVLTDDEGKGQLPKGQLGQEINELVHRITITSGKHQEGGSNLTSGGNRTS